MITAFDSLVRQNASPRLHTLTTRSWNYSQRHESDRCCASRGAAIVLAVCSAVKHATDRNVGNSTQCLIKHTASVACL